MIGHHPLHLSVKHPRNAFHGINSRATDGFTLIEVLVAVVVLSFGLLGMVGVQAFALQANRDSRQQAQAANLARELSELMRSNNLVAVKQNSNENPYLFSSSTGSYNNNCLGVVNVATGCADTTAVANSEMMDWVARVNQALPGARIVVCFDSSPYDSAGLPRWACDGTSSAADPTTVIKLGWTRNSLDRSKTGDAVVERASAQNSRPYIIVPVAAKNS